LEVKVESYYAAVGEIRFVISCSLTSEAQWGKLGIQSVRRDLISTSIDPHVRVQPHFWTCSAGACVRDGGGGTSSGDGGTYSVPWLQDLLEVVQGPGNASVCYVRKYKSPKQIQKYFNTILLISFLNISLMSPIKGNNKLTTNIHMDPQRNVMYGKVISNSSSNPTEKFCSHNV
jgi:hypothetical protein